MEGGGGLFHISIPDHIWEGNWATGLQGIKIQELSHVLVTFLKNILNAESEGWGAEKVCMCTVVMSHV